MSTERTVTINLTYPPLPPAELVVEMRAAIEATLQPGEALARLVNKRSIGPTLNDALAVCYQMEVTYEHKPKPEPRSYVVGLPVVITVDDDGTVTYEVDTSEAGQALREDDAIAVDDHLFDDAALVDADHDRRTAAQT